MERKSTAPQWKIVLAFASLYIIWGSTYLAIKVAIETMPPFIMATTRFALAGVILYLFARYRGARAPTLEQWKHSLIVGALLIAGGNGLVSLAEKWVDSSMAALLVASNPLFMALFGWLGKVQDRPSSRGWGYLAIGFVGVGLLVSSNGYDSGHGSTWGNALIIVAVLSWTFGTVISKRHPQEIDLWLQSGMQMLCGGIVCLFAGSLLGEFSEINVSEISLRSWSAFLYLLVFGSLAGFTSYVYLLKHRSPSAVSSHAYVNPLVAFILGWLILGETLSLAGAIGAALAVFSVFELLRKK